MRESEITKKASSPMVITVKGIIKGLKIIAKIFMHKEDEIKIGYPTDVRHVCHIGLGSSDSCPSWMNEFRRLEASAGSISRSMQISWASLDFEQAFGVPLPAEVSTDSFGHDADSDSTGKPNGPGKKRRTTRPRASSSSSSARSSSLRSTASFATACEDLGDLQSTLRVVA